MSGHAQADISRRHQQRGLPMTRSAAFAALRKRHIALDALPDTIAIPVFEGRQRAATVKAIEEDDIAFAMLAAEAEFNAVGNRLHALRKLYGLTRQAGALGADRAVDALSAEGGR
jgi:hypothetical protein